MELRYYNLETRNELIDSLEKDVELIVNAAGNYQSSESEKFTLTSKLYKNCYNLLAKDILIKKLKISEPEARNIHFSAWENIDFINYHPEKRNLITDYLAQINDLAAEYIKNQYEKDGQTSLSLLIFNQENSDNDEAAVKKRWAFIWRFISLTDEETKKIFMYKLYAGLSFEDISKILKLDEEDIRRRYLEKETELFQTDEFKKFFNIR